MTWVALAIAAVAGGVWVVPYRKESKPDPNQTAVAKADLADLVMQVSARLRAGASTDEAWSIVENAGYRPTVEALVAVGANPGRAKAVVAATELADELGTPLAQALDQISQALIQDAAAEAELHAAMAGTRTSIRVVSWLPFIGLPLGTAIGADPIGELASGGPATLLGLLGLFLAALGHIWVRVLMDRARRWE